MEHWIAPGAAFILGWTLRPLVQTQEVKVAPCNCLCTCECVSREQHSGIGLILLGFLLVVLLMCGGAGYLIYRLKDIGQWPSESPSKGKKGFKGQVLSIVS